MLLVSAHAQDLRLDRFEVPAATLAAENGPGTAWLNPANNGFDPDPRFGAWYTRGLDAGAGTADSAFALRVGSGGSGVGLQVARPAGSDGSSLALDYTAAIQLPERFSIGWRIAWLLPDDAGNFVTNDLGLSWRPSPRLGISGVARNIGSPGIVDAELGGGLAIRPAGDFAVLGAEILRTAAATPLTRARASLRVRPTEGLYLRAGATVDLGDFDQAALTWVGGGLEFYFGGAGVGGIYGTGEDMGNLTVWAGTDEPDETLVQLGNNVPEVNLTQFPAQQQSVALFADSQPTWVELLRRLEKLENDRSVRGVVLQLGNSGSSWARLQELRDRISALEAADKRVVVYLTGYPSTGVYWAAASASHIVLHPAATLNLTGLAAELTFYKGAMDWVGVDAQYVKREKYKSAPEGQIRTGPSEGSLEQTNALLDGIFGHLVSGIAEGRTQEAKTVEDWIDGGPYSANEAVAMGLVDELRYPDELDQILEEVHGEEVNRVGLYDTLEGRSPWESPSQVAIITIEGAIVSGGSGSGGLLGGSNAGSDTIIAQLNAARTDDKVKAVVLRVDSPGGSAFASDEIWRAVERFEEEDKPVVVSMGGVAASGGYYVSAGADAIWAEPTTITGSIGVYSGKFSVGGLFDRVGISTYTIARGRNSSLNSLTSPWDAAEYARMDELVQDTYDQFKSRVADGRGLTLEQVEEVARGRVWTGEAALEVGLVDQLGGLPDAIRDAKQRAGLENDRKVDVVMYGPDSDLFGMLSPALVRMGVVRAPMPPIIPAGLDPLIIPLTHRDEQVWAMDPWLLEVSDR